MTRAVYNVAMISVALPYMPRFYLLHGCRTVNGGRMIFFSFNFHRRHKTATDFRVHHRPSDTSKLHILKKHGSFWPADRPVSRTQVGHQIPSNRCSIHFGHPRREMVTHTIHDGSVHDKLSKFQWFTYTTLKRCKSTCRVSPRNDNKVQGIKKTPKKRKTRHSKKEEGKPFYGGGPLWNVRGDQKH